MFTKLVLILQPFVRESASWKRYNTLRSNHGSESDESVFRRPWAYGRMLDMFYTFILIQYYFKHSATKIGISPWISPYNLTFPGRNSQKNSVYVRAFSSPWFCWPGGSLRPKRHVGRENIHATLLESPWIALEKLKSCLDRMMSSEVFGTPR